jgi:Domain of unknown function (DUF6378)
MKNKDYSEILEEAAKIAKERQTQYGSAVESIQLACDILDITYGIKLNVYQFCCVMDSLKSSRLKFKIKHDSIIDRINYLAIATLWNAQQKKNSI